MFKFVTVIAVAALAVLAIPASAEHCKGKHKNDPGCDGGGGSTFGETLHVFVTMSVGDEITIAQSGPLELFATCTHPAARPEATLITVFITSSQDGWFVATPVSRAADEIHILSEVDGIGPFWTEFDAAPALSQSGFYLATDSGVGVNIAGADCLFAGQVVVIQEP